MFDYSKLRRDLMKAGVGETDSGAKVIDAVENLAYTLDAQGLTETERGIVLQLFSSEGLEQLRMTSGRIDKASRWSDFEIGVTRSGDVIRVKLDAYTTPSGQEHNGLVGVIESVFGGRVGVRYIGRYADNLQTHPRDKIEVLKRV